MNVLSLFDGMSCGQIALNRAGLKYDKYFASEIDKYAIKVTMNNYPNTLQLGDIKDIKGKNLPKINLLLGGSPCFMAGTRIVTRKGYKNIEDIVVGDHVLTHKNRFRQVKRIGSNLNQEIWEVSAQGLKSIRTTGNHPFYVRRMDEIPMKKKVENLVNGDFLGLPILKTSNLMSFKKSIVSDNILWIPFEKAFNTGYREKVYNIEVEEDHSYVAGSYFVGNCQGFSFAGKQLNFEDPRSKLFFEYVRLLEECKPKYFLLENVRMKKEYQNTISKYLGVEPILINSALVSAQNRNRLYWTNIPNVIQPKDRGILLKDIIESGIVDRDKSYCIDANYFKGGSVKNYYEKKRRQIVLSQSETRLMVSNKDFGKNYLQYDKNNKGNKSQDQRVYYPDGKHGCLTSNGCGSKVKVIDSSFNIRKLTVLECERLQTLPEGYTEGVSNTQRYKMLGNGWTLEVIKHILSNLFKEKECNNRKKL